jgi:hypothetical protein
VLGAELSGFTLLFLQVRFSHLDLGTAQYLDTATGQLRPRAELLKKLGKSRSRDRD